MEINVLIDEGVPAPFREDWLEDVVRRVLLAEGSEEAEMGLVVTGAEKVRELNRTYRDTDEPTDVLAFAATEQAPGSPAFVNPPDGVRHLGEVIISYPQAVQQAAEHGHPVEQELALLITHGVLHLLGYDHGEPDAELRMRAREREILTAIPGGKA
jgi:probable rRNA maturation factor